MPSEPEYVFTRDVLDDNRINLQHYIWIQLYGYHVHPNIPTDLSQARIADVGTGTGIWLLDLASKLPGTARIDGLDVSLDAAPQPELFPANVTLREWDIKKPVPEDLVGVYDIVHIRNFSFVLLDAEIPQVLRNLSDLIKPGGYLQWGEPDVMSFRIETKDPECKTEALSRLLQVTRPQDSRLTPRWAPSLPKLFAEAGLVDLESDVREMPAPWAYFNHECNLMLHELLLRQTQNKEVAKAVGELMPEVLAETKKGAWWGFTRYNVIGRKP
ncbi:hypothetical protein VMCG_09957 [Cytospora schulzeri]|uniref:Methyltransferase type 12 domain-containing protein n=1 Tax=Cytospora schulzeri TaxID=448051 RepID=A0A423VIV7_9PEZI|nr:hypothetical protein VMCG_09957 [Valsa malicola]